MTNSTELFDNRGYRIIPDYLSPDEVVKKNGLFFVSKHHPNPSDYQKRHQVAKKIFGHMVRVTEQDFERQSREMLEVISQDALMANVLRGPYLPLILPCLDIADFSAMLDGLMEFLKKSLLFFKPKCCLQSQIPDGFGGLIRPSVVGRQYKVFRKIKQGGGVALFFPQALRGFSLSASQKQMGELPQQFCLSALDTLVALILYPDFLIKGGTSLTLDMAGAVNKMPSLESNLIFSGPLTNGWRLCLNGIPEGLNDASAGLVFV